MKSVIAGAVIMALAIVLAGLAIGGRYEIVQVGDTGTTQRLDRWTGSVAVCAQWEGGAVACANAPELYHDGKTPIVKNSN